MYLGRTFHEGENDVMRRSPGRTAFWRCDTRAGVSSSLVEMTSGARCRSVARRYIATEVFGKEGGGRAGGQFGEVHGDCRIRGDARVSTRRRGDSTKNPVSWKRLCDRGSKPLKPRRSTNDMRSGSNERRLAPPHEPQSAHGRLASTTTLLIARLQLKRRPRLRKLCR